jgi:hypothetical protein
MYPGAYLPTYLPSRYLGRHRRRVWLLPVPTVPWYGTVLYCYSLLFWGLINQASAPRGGHHAAPGVSAGLAAGLGSGAGRGCRQRCSNKSHSSHSHNPTQASGRLERDGPSSASHSLGLCSLGGRKLERVDMSNIHPTAMCPQPLPS